jgi:uncharacterized membrane protein
MDHFRITMWIMQVTFSVLLIALSIPLIKRKIAPNSWYGFRVRQTLEDPGIWYEANAYSGNCLMWAGVVMLVGSVALFAVPGLDGPAYATACTVVDFAAIGMAVIQSFRFLGRIAKPNEF